MVLAAQSDAVIGERMVRAEHGKVSFAGLQIIAAPGEYNIKFASASANSATPAEVGLIVRDCHPGEEKLPLLCTECPEGFFSYSPEVGFNQIQFTKKLGLY